ncbi:MAG TPA: CocE/NonD family hydrolase [Candidatus Limnocylindria bacterium]|jgi:putative CocE/NonD family hydrolase|nr:CocE/NonD family hydrolase [Candidatus Limnocylindria bacterium]
MDCGSGITLERGVRLQLPDGTELVSDHYYPAFADDHANAPTLLVRQPYGRAIATTVTFAQPEWFARNGYNVVIQDVRGRGDSSGSFYPFRDEGSDGAFTIDWLAGRPECNGRVGMYGFSYQGMTQLLAAAEQPAGLACIAPAQTAGDLYHGWFYHHGALRLGGTIGWATQMLKSDARRLRLRKASDALEAAWLKLPSLFAQTPYAKISELNARGLPTYFRDWVTHDAPGDYWAAHDISRRYDRIRVPGLHLAGWFDPYLFGSISLYENLVAHAGSKHARANQYLVAGPWVHIPWGQFAGETDFGPAANLDTDGLLLRWFNHWLKDGGDFTHEPKVRLFALGENQWHSLKTWPSGQPRALSAPSPLHGERAGVRGEAARAKMVASKEGSSQSVASDSSNNGESLGVATPHPTPLLVGSGGDLSRMASWFLHSGGFANSSKGDGSLNESAPTSEDPRDSFCYEPEVPVLAPGNGAPGQFNQARAELLNNLLVYTGPELGGRLHVCGAPRVVLFAQTSAAQTDLVAKLVRVTRDGRALNVCLGIARSDFLFPDRSHEPDTPQRWEFALEPTSCVFLPGERLRLEVSSSAFPLYDRHPNWATPPAFATSWDWRQARTQILHDATHASVLELPLLNSLPLP